ncbi:class I SAM-dependent methyltransferase [Candidatus Chlorohelix allophototropha]|uniref:Class I SAM-dependent methyltransferase n=1 Tax=Candidatus Chlorohelix allophototropha TaxID=3003348 RepID=A0ABY9AZP8_9CHLR|nr:class I SAM-dependent methyltransferase [Chloroflexota bacterium L227-S17]
MLEIGCGLGRIAFPLRFLISQYGSYDGFEITREKVDFLQANFQKTFPNFRFVWANIHNTYYNPYGEMDAREYIFPYTDNSFDLIYAASVYTHLLPDYTAHYFSEAARVLKKGGRCVFSFFLLDNYQPGRVRLNLFSSPIFNFDFSYQNYGDEFAIGNTENPEEMTAYRLGMVERFAAEAGLELAQPPIDGKWSGKSQKWLSTQDLVILVKP